MSLKAFHLCFCIIAGAVLVGFGAWCFEDFQNGRNATILVLGLTSVALGVLTPFYLRWFLKKLSGIGFVAILGLFSNGASACPVCLGNPDHPMVKSVNSGVFFLLAVTAMVLVPLAAVFIAWAVRSRRMGPLSLY